MWYKSDVLTSLLVSERIDFIRYKQLKSGKLKDLHFIALFCIMRLLLFDEDILFTFDLVVQVVYPKQRRNFFFHQEQERVLRNGHILSAKNLIN